MNKRIIIIIINVVVWSMTRTGGQFSHGEPLKASDTVEKVNSDSQKAQCTEWTILGVTRRTGVSRGS